MLEQQVTLSSATVLSLIRRRGAEPHNVLANGRTWHSDDTLGEQDRLAHAELDGTGLRARSGVDQGLLNTIDAVAHPTTEYYGWIAGGYNGESLNYSVLAGLGAGEAFVLARNTDTEAVVLVTVQPDKLLENFIAQLPALPPGKGQPLSAPQSEVTGEASELDVDAGSIMQTNRPNAGSGPATEIKRIIGLARLGGGTLYVATRNRAGTRQRVQRPVNYIDTEEGRWLTEKTPGAGEPLVVLTPATPQLFADRLKKAHSSLG